MSGHRLLGLLLVSAVTALASGCAGRDGDGEQQAGATTTVAVTQVVTETVGATTAPAADASDEELSFEGFRTPSRNISCVAAQGAGLTPYLRCTIGELAKPPPRPASCEFDWGHWLALGANGPGAWACVSDAMVPDAGYVTLPYGSVWERGPFTCHSRAAGLRCANSDGHGFELSRERQRLF
jgi:hypothetical protein